MTVLVERRARVKLIESLFAAILGGVGEGRRAQVEKGVGGPMV